MDIGYDIEILKKSPNEWKDFHLISDCEVTRIILKNSVILCNSMSDLLEALNLFKEKGWIYRGLSDHEYPLQTTFERCFIKGYCQGEISKFKKIYLKLRNKYREEIPNHMDVLTRINKDNDFEWFACMQHYGAPTPLLDWTESADIALFFSVFNNNISNSEKYHCIWCLNKNLTYKKSIEIINNRIPDLNLNDDPHEFNKNPNIMKNILDYFSLDDNCHGFIIPLPTNKKNEREIAQKALFTLNGSLIVDFAYNFASMFINNDSELTGATPPLEKDGVLKKIIFPKNILLDINKHLSDLKIDRSVLFPNLIEYFSSFSQSLSKTMNEPYDPWS
jgi:hypothetical protein